MKPEIQALVNVYHSRINEFCLSGLFLGQFRYDIADLALQVIECIIQQLFKTGKVLGCHQRRLMVMVFNFGAHQASFKTWISSTQIVHAKICNKNTKAKNAKPACTDFAFAMLT